MVTRICAELFWETTCMTTSCNTHPRTGHFDRLNQPKTSAAALGYRMPAEFEPLDCVWLAPPDNEETWPGCLEQAQRQFADWMDKLRQVVTVRTTRELNIPVNDSWIRDFGPIFVTRGKSASASSSSANIPAGAALTAGSAPPLACHDFHFNSWGEKYEVRDLDDVVPQHVAKVLGLPIWVHDFVLEGGSIEVNGRGTVLTSEQCLLNANRNPEMSRKQIVDKLHETLGTRHVIWLPGGIEGDDTDGHIDDVARFISPDTVAIIAADPGHPDHAMTQANIEALRGSTDQDGNALNIVQLPMPQPVMYEYPEGKSPVPASYANFLIANKHVFVPVFGQVSDEQALRVLDDVMSSYSIVPIRAEHLVVGLGALHCLSQQQPAVVV